VTDQEVLDTWVKIANKHGEDVAQESLCQAFQKAKRGAVEKPLHYAAASANHIAKDERRRRVYALAYQRLLSGMRLDWEPEIRETDVPPLVMYTKTRVPKLKKTPNISLRETRTPANQVEAKELLREVEHDPMGKLLIRQTLGENVRINPTEASRARARLRRMREAE
jgi:DNA-directed RNA polymerase specialized sigma24 family protein